MKTLTIFHDPECGLCAGFKKWLEARPKHTAVEFVGIGSVEAQRRFPGLLEIGGAKDVVVLADDGRWWQGTDAWITCLWVTRDYREWSFRLASPAMRPFVRQAVRLLSQNRLTLSRLLRMPPETHPTCNNGTCPL